jgi:hypothetical protein
VRARPHTRDSELDFVRIDPQSFNRRASLDEQFGEGAGAAAHVDPT